MGIPYTRPAQFRGGVWGGVRIVLLSLWPFPCPVAGFYHCVKGLVWVWIRSALVRNISEPSISSPLPEFVDRLIDSHVVGCCNCLKHISN